MKYGMNEAQIKEAQIYFRSGSLESEKLGGQCLLLSNKVKDTLITTITSTTTTSTTITTAITTTITTGTTTKCVSTRWVKCPDDQKHSNWTKWRRKGRRKRALKEADYHGDKLDDSLFDAYSELDGFSGSEQSQIEYWGARAPSAQPR